MNSKQNRIYIDTASKKSCNDAINELVIFGPSADKFTYLGSVRISGADWKAAKAIGNARKALHDREGGRKAGEIRYFDNETEGVLAELKLRDLLRRYTGNVKIAPYVDDLACSGYDAIVDGIHLDAKAVRLNSRVTAINQRSHLRTKSDVYLIARVADDRTLDLFALSPAVVSRWRLEKPLDENGRACPRKWYYAGPLPPPLESSREERLRTIEEAFAVLSAA